MSVRSANAAGKVRDLDVLIGHLAGVHVDGTHGNGAHSDAEAECQVQLLEHLGGERRKRSGKLRAWISKHRAELNHGLRKTSARVEKFSKKNEPERASMAAARALQLSSELNSPRSFNRRNLHPYRLKVKQLRYVLQLAASEDMKFVEDLGKVKDAIGEWHEWEELVAIAEDILDHGPGCKLIQKLKEITNSKFEHAVRVAENLRKKYLKTSSHKQRKPPDRGVELAPAAIAAAAALSETSSQRAA